MKFYIAFSVSGTNTFITANIITDDHDYSYGQESVTVTGIKFWKKHSRRFDYKKEDGVKLHCDRLNTIKGTPYRSAPLILRFFNELEAAGWVVEKEKFVKKHWNK